MDKDGGIALKRLKMDQIGLKIDQKAQTIDQACFLADIIDGVRGYLSPPLTDDISGVKLLADLGVKTVFDLFPNKRLLFVDHKVKVGVRFRSLST